MKNKCTATVAIAMLLLGCVNDDISSRKLFLKEIIQPQCSREVFEYESGQLISYKTWFGERLSVEMQFDYKDGRLSAIKSNGLRVCELRYGSNGLIAEEVSCSTLGGDTKCMTMKYYEYDEKQHLKFMKYGFNDPHAFPTEIEFIWENGNIVRENYYFTDRSGRHYAGSRTFQYDNKQNFTNHDVAFLFLQSVPLETVLSKNNLISATENYSGGTIDRGTYSFTYNSLGYPTGYIYKVDFDSFSFTEMNYQ